MAAQLEDDGVDARVVKALGHPTRVRILTVLRDRELASPVELSSELGLALGTVGYHVRKLEDLGFIELAKRTQRRGAVEHHYRARAVLDAQVEPSVEAGLPRDGRGAEAADAARMAQGALAGGGFDATAARADRRVLTLDDHARGQLSRVLPDWQATVERIARASATRLAGAEEATAHRCVAVLMHFDVDAAVGGDER